MTNLSIANLSDDGSSDLSSDLLQQQQLMTQLLQMGQRSQQKLAARQDAAEHKVYNLERAVSKALIDVKELQSASRLITINQLSTMLKNIWSEKEKNAIGVQLAKFSRAHHVVPGKVAHPTLPNGVNGYEPSIVKAWLEENGMHVPVELQYVD